MDMVKKFLLLMCITFLIGNVSASWTSNLNSGLVSYYNFDTNTGTILNDNIGHIHNGTMLGGTSWTTGVLGSSIEFNGVNGQVNITNAIGLLGNTYNSVSWWWYPITNSTTTQYFWDGGLARNYHLMQNGGWDFRMGGTDNIQMFGTNLITYSSIGGFNLNAWHQITVVYDSATGDTQFWFDGISRVNDTAEGGSYTPQNNSWIVMGTRYTGASPLNARMDEMGFWNRKLTGSEILQLYNGGNGLAYSTAVGNCSITGLNSKQGINTWTMWANDSAGNLNFSSVTFSVGTEEPITIQINPVDAVTLNGGTTKVVNILFNTSSANVIGVSAQVNLTNGAITRTSNSCTNVSMEFTCPVTLNFYDEAGVWNISASIIDSSANLIENTSETFVVNSLDYVSQNLNYFDWSGALSLGVDNQEASNIITLTNEGNQNYATLNIKGQNATGVVYSNIIPADKFSIDNITASTSGIHLIDNTNVDISSRLNLNSHGASVSANIYAYVDVPTGIKADNYLSSTAWEMTLI